MISTLGVCTEALRGKRGEEAGKPSSAVPTRASPSHDILHAPIPRGNGLVLFEGF